MCERQGAAREKGFQLRASDFLSAKTSHPASNATPPIGVIAPSQRVPVAARTYKVPLKMMIPVANSHHASREKFSPRQIAKRTTA